MSTLKCRLTTEYKRKLKKTRTAHRNTWHQCIVKFSCVNIYTETDYEKQIIHYMFSTNFLKCVFLLLVHEKKFSCKTLMNYIIKTATQQLSTKTLYSFNWFSTLNYSNNSSHQNPEGIFVILHRICILTVLCITKKVAAGKYYFERPDIYSNFEIEKNKANRKIIHLQNEKKR